LLDQAFGAVRAAKKAGVRIATGSDFGGGSVRPGHLAWEVQMLVRAGLEPHEALASATWIGGELLGIKDAGTIREGGPADVVLVVCRVLRVAIARSVARPGGCRPRTIRPHGSRLLQAHERSSATRGIRRAPARREGRAPREPARRWGFPHHVAVRPTCR